MMDPDHELFVSIVDEGGLAAAGRRLHISPAMMSKRLARLEDRLGARLIHRTTRRLALTPAGERLHGDLRAILASLDEAERRVSGVSAIASGPLRITAPTSFGRMHLAPYLRPFLDAHPRPSVSPPIRVPASPPGGWRPIAASCAPRPPILSASARRGASPTSSSTACSPPMASYPGG